MKKNVLALCSLLAMLGMNMSVSAQQNGGELNIMVSDAVPTLLVLTFFDDLGESLQAAYFDYDKENSDTSMPGMISIGYSHKVAKWLSLGGDVGYMQINRGITLTSKDGSKPDRQVDRKTNAFIVMPTAKFYYLQRSKVSMYGLLGAGLLHATKTETSGDIVDKRDMSGVAFQINPLGVRVGNRFAGFAELGFGMKGFMVAGFSMRL